MIFNAENINWNRLYNIHKSLTVFQPTLEKLQHLYEFIIDGKFNTSDENRTPDKVGILIDYFFGDTQRKFGAFHLFFEIGDYDGLLGLTDINCAYKCNLFFKLWNKDNFTHNNVRAIKKLLDIAMEELKLKRISLSTPDKKGVRMAEMCDFKIEGNQKYGFLWDGEPYTNYLLRKLGG